MSLRVWLPLNGTLENKGLSDINLTATPTYVTGGKIGNQCLASQLGWFAIPDMAGKKQMSFAYWVKINTATSTNWLDTFSWFSTDGTTPHRCRQEFYTNSTQTGVWFYGGSIGTTFRNTVGDWNHYVFTIDYDKGEAKFYINGKLTNTNLEVDTTNYIQGTGSAFLLRESTLDSHINDFRLYDHILSPMEVKQISQGLILHYPLNRNGWGQENLLTKTVSEFSNWTNINSDCVTVTSNNYKNVFLLTQGVGGKWENVYSPAISVEANKEYTISCFYKVYDNYNFTPSYGDFGLTVMKAVPTNANPISNTIARASFKNVSGGFWKAQATFTPTITTIYLNMCGGSIVDGQTNKKFDVNYIKLEEGSIATPWCPNSTDELATSMGINNNIQYDTSGYRNNGTKIGSFSYDSDTPKYNVSTVFPSGVNWINAGRGAMIQDSITISCWINYSTWGNPISCTEGGGWNFEEGNGGIRAPFYISGIGYKIAQSTITSASLKNGWHMLTSLYDRINSTVKIFIDGELAGSLDTGTTNKIVYHGGNVIMIGAEAGGSATSPASTSFIGKISDVRIYCTALSAEDIKSLYNNSAYIDNQGNIYGAVYEEV